MRNCKFTLRANHRGKSRVLMTHLIDQLIASVTILWLVNYLLALLVKRIRTNLNRASCIPVDERRLS